jgi:Protein of unknown function (DUF1640)
MAASSIPRYLLPQITWQASIPRGLSYAARPVFTPPRNRETPRSVFYRHVHYSPRSPSPPMRSPQLARLTRTLYNALSSSLTPTATALHRSSSASSIASDATIRPFHTTPPRFRDHHFDTLKFVQRLRDEGFSEEQATAMMRVLSDVIEESIQNLTRTMVPREDAERATYTQKVDFTKLRSELLTSDGTESQVTRTNHERLANDLAKLNSKLRDEISRTQASVRLDLNLEKGRIREEANTQELKLKETESRIEQEVAGLRERIEGVKFSTLQWLM